MNKNVGTLDRVIRLMIGLILLAYAVPIGFPVTGWNAFGWIGFIPVTTAVLATCPLYSILGFSTCKTSA